MSSITNTHGTVIDFDAAVNLMDADLCDDIHNSLTDGINDQEFFDLYCTAHIKKFGEEFEPAKANPVW